ncbi:50S ribosomal protein L17 [Arcanobacterium hippocoleae]
MPKPTKGARLGGSPAHERLIIANLCKQLILNESIVTTEAKAKRVRPYVEKLITKAKKGDTHNRRLALSVLRDREAAYVLFEELAPKFADRDGGYTRIVKLPNRKGDNAPQAEISLVLEAVSAKPKPKQDAEPAAAVQEEPAAAEETTPAAAETEVESEAAEMEAEAAEEVSEAAAK